MEALKQELHIPEGINYECTSCGKCCGGWAVPMTESDYDRISEVDWGAYAEAYKGKDLFRPLKHYEKVNTPYTHKIVSETGTCPFLVDKLCFIHGKFDSAFKPTICQLFPYCFSETPSGVYATVSFVSMGAIYNSGKALREQKDVLEAKWSEFKSLYPNYYPDWSKLKLTVGVPMSWDEYLGYERELFSILNNQAMPIEERLINASACLNAKLQKSTATAGSSYQLKKLDKHLLCAFHKMYFPARPLKRGQGDFSLMRFIQQVILEPPTLRFATTSYDIDSLKEFPYPDDDAEINNLIYRYLYSYIFGKKYFGAGFGQLSLIVGFHHLIMVYALLKLHAKGIAKERGAPIVSLIDVVATIKQLETHLGETKIGANEAGIFELLLFSHGRAQRFLKNC